MPNYSLVMDSTFQPMSLERMLQPFQLYGQMYREQQDALTDLETKASIWDGLANKETDKKTYEQYSKYASDLRAQADKIATQGLDINSRQAMKNLQSRYAKEIIPIENAYNTRKEQIAAQAKQGYGMLNSYNAATTSLDDYMANPSKMYETIDLNKVLSETTALMSPLAKELKQFTLSKDPAVKDRFHKVLTKQYGLTNEEATQYMSDISSGKADANSVIGQVAQRMYDGTRVDDRKIWSDNDRSTVWGTIGKGVMAAVGASDKSLVKDEQALLDAKYAQEIKLLKEKQRITAEEEAKKKLEAAGAKYQYRNVYTPKEIGDFAKDWNKYKDYFEFDKEKNIWVMNKKGKNAVTYTVDFHTGERTGKSDFGKFLDKYGINDMHEGKSGPWQSGIIDRLSMGYTTQYDATKSTEHYGRVDVSQHDNILSILNSNASNGKLQNYTMDNSKGSYKLMSSGKSIDISDLKATDIKSAEIVFGTHGNYLKVNTSKGEINIPYSSISQKSASINNLVLQNIETARAAQANGATTWTDPTTGKTMSIDEYLASELNAVGNNMMSGLGFVQTEPIKVAQTDYYGI